MSKKLLSFFTILSVVLLFASCEGPRGLDGLPGPPGEGMNWKVFNLNAKQGAWKWDNTANEYYQDFEAPEITDFVNKSGKVFGDELITTDTYEPCPSTVYFYDKDSNTDIAETTTFDHTKGWIRIKLRALDSFGSTPLDYQPKAKTIRVIVIW